MHTTLISKLFCPFLSAISPHVQAVDDATIGWAEHFHLLTDSATRRHLELARVGWLIAGTTPYAGRDGLQLLADWCTWLFLLDDQCDEQGIGTEPESLRALHARSLAILGGAYLTAADTPASHALSDLGRRIRAIAAAHDVDRFIMCVAQSFEASIWEARNRAQGIIPTVQCYMEQRALTGGLYMVLALTEIADGIHLAAHLRMHPVVQQLLRCTANAVCWANDLISLPKELKQGDVHNLVIILQHAYGVPLPDALYRAAALHDGQVRTFMDLERRLPPGTALEQTQLQHYVALLRFWMRGNLDWATASGRYQTVMLDAPAMQAMVRTH